MTAHTISPEVEGAEGGFTLVEMMVVLVIVALLAGLSIVSMRRGVQEKSVGSLASEIQALFLHARTNAIARGRREAVVIDLAGREVRYAPTRQEIAIPEGIRPSLLVGQELVAADGETTLLFFPDGASSGAEMSLVGQKGDRAGIRVPWLTGAPVVVREP